MAIAYKKWICFAAFSIISPLCYADHFNFFISGGPTLSRLDNSQNVAINPFVVNSYQANPRNDWNGYGGLGFGHSFERIKGYPFSVSLALAGYTMNLGTVKGTEYPLINDGLYDTLNYHFDVRSLALMLESRWFYTCFDSQPFVLIGIGGAWNKFKNYNEVPTNPALSAAPVPQEFSDHTNSAFAYELGFGVQQQLYKTTASRIYASLDYRYFNMGKGHLGSFPAQTASDRIHIDNLYTQAVTLSFIVSIK